MITPRALRPGDRIALVAPASPFDQAELEPGEWILVHAGGSGVGSAAIQLARLVGANVITTAGSDEKVEKAKALGAQHGINYKTHDFLHEVRRITKKRGVDVVIEHIGEDVWERSLLCLTTGGRLVTCGATTGPIGETDIRIVFWRQLRIIGSTMSNRKEFRDVMSQLFAGRLKAIVDRTFPLAETATALSVLQKGEQFGKLVVTVP